MDIKYLLTSCISLLFLSSHINATEQQIASKVAGDALVATKSIKPLNLDSGADIITELKNVINWQINLKDYDKSLLEAQLKLKLKEDTDSINSILSVIDTKQTDEKSLYKRLRGLKGTCSLYINKLTLLNRFDDTRFMYRLADVGSEKEKDLLVKINEDIAKVIKGGDAGNSLIGTVDFSNKDSIKSALAAGKKEYSLVGILKFGLQGWNNLYGDHQGQRRGETLLLSAMGHSYKSGRLLNAFCEVMEFNEPTYVTEASMGKHPDERKACAIHITIENNFLGDMRQALKYFKEQETGVEFHIDDNDDSILDEYADYLNAKLARPNGIHGFIEQHDASTLTVDEYKAIIEKYQNMGYEIHFVSLDYAGRMSTKGCIASSGSGSEKRDLMKHLQADALKHKYALMTAWQMSSDAQTKLREGEQFLVKAVCELGYYLDCRTVHNEVDMEVYQAFVYIGNKKYITWQRGKHRKPGNQPDEKMKFCCYETDPVAFVKWDIGKKAGYSSRLGTNNNVIGGGEFFD